MKCGGGGRGETLEIGNVVVSWWWRKNYRNVVVVVVAGDILIVRI